MFIEKIPPALPNTKEYLYIAQKGDNIKKITNDFYKSLGLGDKKDITTFHTTVQVIQSQSFTLVLGKYPYYEKKNILERTHSFLYYKGMLLYKQLEYDDGYNINLKYHYSLHNTLEQQFEAIERIGRVINLTSEPNRFLEECYNLLKEDAPTNTYLYVNDLIGDLA